MTSCGLVLCDNTFRQWPLVGAQRRSNGRVSFEVLLHDSTCLAGKSQVFYLADLYPVYTRLAGPLFLPLLLRAESCATALFSHSMLARGCLGSHALLCDMAPCRIFDVHLDARSLDLQRIAPPAALILTSMMPSLSRHARLFQLPFSNSVVEPLFLSPPSCGCCRNTNRKPPFLGVPHKTRRPKTRALLCSSGAFGLLRVRRKDIQTLLAPAENFVLVVCLCLALLWPEFSCSSVIQDTS